MKTCLQCFLAVPVFCWTPLAFLLLRLVCKLTSLFTALNIKYSKRYTGRQYLEGKKKPGRRIYTTIAQTQLQYAEYQENILPCQANQSKHCSGVRKILFFLIKIESSLDKFFIQHCSITKENKRKGCCMFWSFTRVLSLKLKYYMTSLFYLGWTCELTSGSSQQRADDANNVYIF